MSEKPTGEDIARHYETAHTRIGELIRTLSDDQLATPVPSTPGWDVHDVLAHLAAIPTDALAGRLTGVPTPEFTSEQVRQRKAATAEELLEEWSGNMAAMLDVARTGLVPPTLSVDALTHEQDIRGALGMASALAPDELRFCLTLYSLGCHHTLKQAVVAPLAITATDTDFATIVGGDEPAVTVRAPEFELFRGLSGRRSRAQVLGFAWDGDPTPYVERFSLFGDLPDDDVND